MDDLFDTEQPMQRREPVLDVTSHVFQPKKYIQRVLAGIPHAVFEGELVDRVGQAEEDTGEALKQLIRDNLAVFVNSKDAMDAVYHSDQELFTGEALDGITNSFKSATASCDALVQPITATFVEVQKSRKSQDMLDKLFSVLGVPGAIYDCCGAKVATRRVTATTGADNSGTSDEEAADKRGVEDGDDDDDDDDADDAPQRQKNNVKAGGGARSRRMKSPYSDDDEEDEEDDEEDEESESGGSDVDKVHAAPPKAHGTLESPAGPTNLADVFIYAPEEEIYLWYGTPLVRLRDVDERRHHVEEVSNYEAAVLHLRRAMMYVEETYSLVDGTLLAGDDGDLPRSPTAQQQQQQHPASEGRLSPSPGAAASGGGGGVNAGAAAARQASITASSFTSPGAVQRSAFAYKFAMALLRAALYLCSQLAEELVYANPADTVLIEDTLSTMMDASIATVKLRHFCSVLQKFIELGKQHKASLTKLRTQLAGPAGTDSTTAGDGTANDGAAKMAVGSSDPLGGATAATTAAAAANAGLPRRRPPIYQHPVQYFVSIVQKQHRHLLSTSAAALLQEAKAWMWKAQTDAARGLEERHRQRELQRKLRAAAAATGVDATGGGGDAASLGATGTFGPAFANSFMGGSVAGEGGYIGNSNDSFLQDTSFGWVNRRGGGASSGSPTKLEGSGTAAPQRLDGTGSGGGGGGGGDAQQFVSLVPEAFVKRVLDAFNTPESPFPTVTELKVGASDMDAVLLSSCLQIRLHAASLLSQLFTRADVESAVMAQATSLNTFALRLCAECVGTLEHVVGAYWSGIATTVHAGVFDFAPDGVLRDMLAELLADSGDGAADAQANAGAGGASADAAAGVSVRVSGEADGLQRSPSTMLGDGGSHLHSRTASAVERDDSGTGVGGGGGGGGGGADMINGGAAQSSAQRVPGMGSGSTDQLPRVRFVPVLPLALQQSLNAEAKMRATGTADPNAHPPCLRDTSVQAVHQMIATATTTLQSLFLTFINKGVVDGFVSTMARYRVSDAARYSRTERMELHAAVLYEILLGQWERMMNLVSDSVLRLKIVMGETSSSTTVHSDSQVEELGDLLQALEALRSTCLRTYLHGVGVLSKAYLTMLPLLQRRSDTLLDSRVRSRLSRESVSSNTVHKLLNVLSVVVDRCVPFFTRDTEVYDSVDLFSVKAETLKEDEDEDGDDDDGRSGGRSGGGARGGATGRRFRLMRSRRGGGGQQQQEYGRRSSRGSVTSSASPAPAAGNNNNGGGGTDGAVDPVSELLAQYHSKLVVESLQDHEELVLALLSHLLLAFVDTLQLKCRAATTDAGVDPDERERSVVECMADTLSLATTLTPILMEHLLSPCFFELIARQLPDVAVSASAVAALLESKQQQYVQTYLSVVEEHCQLAVDAMMNTYLALTQQPITDFVRRQGFVQPLFDWQRVSRHTTAAVRPYIADAVACIARARETLNAIRQPILGSAATQRLVAHLVRVFLTAFTSDINVFELSGECSPNFLVMGLTLLEAEALTILKVVDTVVAHAAANPTSSELSPELVVARGSLSSFAASLEAYAIGVCESIAVTRGREGTSDVLISLTLLSREKRRERRDEMVQAALRTLGYMLEAVNVELEESSLSSAGLMQARSSVTESIVQRLEHRNDGYELRRAKAAQKEQDRKDAEKRAAAAAALSRRKGSADVSSAATAAAAGDSAAGRRRLVHRRPDGAPPLQAPGGGAAAEEDGDVVVTPRTARESESESTNAVAAASNVLQLAQDQQHKTKVRKVRKVRKVAAALEVGEEGAEAAPAAVPVAPRSTAPAPPPAPLRQPAARVDRSEEEDDAEEDAPVRTRPARRARRGGAAEDGGAPEPRERRANRFRRSNVV